MVHPTVKTMIYSTIIGGIASIALAGWFFESTAAWKIAALALGSIGLPCGLAFWLRNRKPIAAANFAERQAAWPVILLAAFVAISSARLNPSDFFSLGLLAIGLSLSLRIISAMLTRWSSCIAPDDYLSFAFPNLFVLVLLGQMLGLPELSQFAAWMLLPVFVLAPIDTWICRRFAAKSAGDYSLRGHLRIGPKQTPRSDLETLPPMPVASKSS